MATTRDQRATGAETKSLRRLQDGRLDEAQTDAMRREVWALWSGHRDVWAICVGTDDEDRTFVLFDIGDGAEAFPAFLTIEALGGFKVPLRTCVVGCIVPY